MRHAVILALVLSGCSREPTFDERYAATEQKLSEKAAAIDRDVSSVAELPSQEASPKPQSGPAKN